MNFKVEKQGDSESYREQWYTASNATERSDKIKSEIINRHSV